MLAVVVVVAALLLPAHNASQGKSSFVVGADGVVAIHIELLEIDLPELCDVEINLADPQRRVLAEQKLEACVARELPRWLRLRSNDDECTVFAGRTTHGPGLQVDIDGDARCAPLQGRTLTIDWGLFQSSSLNHQSTSTLTLPDGSTTRALLSKRKNRWSVPIADPRRAQAAAVAAVVVVVALITAAVARARRRARPAPPSTSPPP